MELAEPHSPVVPEMSNSEGVQRREAGPLPGAQRAQCLYAKNMEVCGGLPWRGEFLKDGGPDGFDSLGAHPKRHLCQLLGDLYPLI